MTYAATVTATSTTTMTEARVRAVMQKVSANFTAFVVKEHISTEIARKWTEDIAHLQLVEALKFFDIKIQAPTGNPFGVRYTVSSDGSLQQDSASGGLNLYGLPPGTQVSLYAELHDGTPSSVYDWLRARGWGFNGTRLEGQQSQQRAFSSDGYGLVRQHLGTWP